MKIQASIHYKNILEEASNNNIKMMALHILLKERSSNNSTIYGWNYHRIAKMSNLTWHTAKILTDKLITRGLLTKHGNNLHVTILTKQIHSIADEQSSYTTIKSVIKENNKEKKRMKIHFPNDYHKILNKLKVQIIEIHKNQQRRNSAITRASIHTKKVAKIIRKQTLASGDLYINLSSRSIAKLFGVSHSTIMNDLRKLAKLKLLYFKEKLKEVSFEDYKEAALERKRNKGNTYIPFPLIRKYKYYIHQGLVVMPLSM